MMKIESKSFVKQPLTMNPSFHQQDNKDIVI